MSYIHETDEEMRERLRSLLYGEDIKDNAQMSLNELSRYILGEDWYTTMGISNYEVNPIIVYEIERTVRENRSNVKKRRIKQRIKKLEERARWA